MPTRTGLSNVVVVVVAVVVGVVVVVEEGCRGRMW
jgi:hypothetical protein